MKKFAILACATALAACSNGSDAEGEADVTGDVETTEVDADAASPAAQMLPGQWEVKAEITDIEAANLPEAMRDTLLAQTADAMSTSMCLTEEQVAAPGAGVFGAPPNENCTTTDERKGANSYGVTMSCDMQQAGTMAMTMDGEFSEESYEMTFENSMSGGPADMTTKGKIVGTRTGDCA